MLIGKLNTAHGMYYVHFAHGVFNVSRDPNNEPSAGYVNLDSLLKLKGFDRRNFIPEPGWRLT